MRNHILYITVILFATMSCHKDTQPIALDRHEVTLNVGEQIQLRASPEGLYTWSTSNNFTLDISPTGLVSSKFKGSGNVFATATDGRKVWCSVTVVALTADFEEPHLAFGMHQREITATEKREVTFQSKTLLIFNDSSPMVERLYYYFGENGMQAAGIELHREKLSDENFDRFMGERYQNEGVIDGQQCYRGFNVFIGIEDRDKLRIVRYYRMAANTTSLDSLSISHP